MTRPTSTVAGSTAVLIEAELLSETGSTTAGSPETAAVLVIVVFAALLAGITTMVIARRLPASRLAKVAVTVPATESKTRPAVELAASNVTLAGSVSTTETLVVLDGPLFVATIV